jgi:hypothetical protein
MPAVKVTPDGFGGAAGKRSGVLLIAILKCFISVLGFIPQAIPNIKPEGIKCCQARSQVGLNGLLDSYVVGAWQIKLALRV